MQTQSKPKQTCAHMHSHGQPSANTSKQPMPFRGWHNSGYVDVLYPLHFSQLSGWLGPEFYQPKEYKEWIFSHKVVKINNLEWTTVNTPAEDVCWSGAFSKKTPKPAPSDCISPYPCCIKSLMVSVLLLCLPNSSKLGFTDLLPQQCLLKTWQNTLMFVFR